MTRPEWRKLVAQINSDIAGIAKAQNISKEIKSSIASGMVNLSEEQIIDEEAFNQSSDEPRIVEVYGIELRVWKLHRRGLLQSDIKGADLFYEIPMNKYILVQYKKSNAYGRVEKDKDQLDQLVDSCPLDCPPSNRFGCGAWLGLAASVRKSYFPACEARAIFGRHASRKDEFFINGLTKEQFRLDFANCYIGGRLRQIEDREYRRKSDEYVQMSVENDRLVTVP